MTTSQLSTQKKGALRQISTLLGVSLLSAALLFPAFGFGYWPKGVHMLSAAEGPVQQAALSRLTTQFQYKYSLD